MKVFGESCAASAKTSDGDNKLFLPQVFTCASVMSVSCATKSSKGFLLFYLLKRNRKGTKKVQRKLLPNRKYFSESQFEICYDYKFSGQQLCE